MLWELCGIQNGRHDLPDANRSGKMGPVPRSNHRQFPRHIPQGFSDYDVGEVYLAPGATVTIELPASESIFFVGVSDDGVIRGTGSSDRVASGSDATADPNLMTAVPVGGDKDHK